MPVGHSVQSTVGAVTCCPVERESTTPAAGNIQGRVGVESKLDSLEFYQINTYQLRTQDTPITH